MAAEESLAKGQALAMASAAASTYGLPIDVDPFTALLEEVARTNGIVNWLGKTILALDPRTLTRGVTTIVDKGGAGATEITTEVRRNIYLDLYKEERAHLVKVCHTAISCGLSERQVKLAESQGALIAELLGAVIADPELGLSPRHQEVALNVACRHLRALPVA